MSPTLAQLKAVAERTWRGPVQSIDPTNRENVYFMDTPGHGGYVVPVDSLTQDEIEKIHEYVIQTGNSFVPDPKTHQIIVFEEDCEYRVLEFLTGICRTEFLDEHGNYRIPGYKNRLESAFVKYYMKQINRRSNNV
ncbi:hypothetical protein [Bacteroides sp.]|uniref:hypothetical protein n=1 Tax=Bacteroides sp. TaxID=29523 RepID=UPI002636B2C3|nr:hypothetical protein [Bacteroides sp.]MDD3039101.1 hypothetical protein [Bacteroides sp.]